jgi:hypothetical protein
MSINSRWVKLDVDRQVSLEGQIYDTAFGFIRASHGKYSPSVAARLANKSVRSRGRKLLRELLAINLASIDDLNADSILEKDAFGESANKFRKIQEILDSIPDEHLSIIENENSYHYDFLFSSDLYNILSSCSVFFRRKSWKTRGRPADIVLRNTISACVRTLEYITNDTFKKNFHSEDTPAGLTFTNPDCAYCEAILKLISPSLKHEEVKAGLKLHFSTPRAQSVRYVGPSRRPIYGGPQKPKKTE